MARILALLVLFLMPTRISYTETAWNTAGASKSTGAAVSWSTNDVIVVVGLAEGAAGGSVERLGTPSATGLSFTKNKKNTATSTCESFVATAVAGSSSSATVSVTSSDATQHWGFAVWVYSDTAGVGNSSEQHTATKTVALTPTGADCAVVWASADFNADAAGSGTPTPTTTDEATQDAGHYTPHVFDLTDQTSGGSTSYGTSGGGSTGPFSIVVQEIKVSAAAAAVVVALRPKSRPFPFRPGAARSR